MASARIQSTGADGLPAPTLAISEVFGFDEDLLALVPQPVYGVIVSLEDATAISSDGGDRAAAHGGGDDFNAHNDQRPAVVPFYMKQAGTLDNACGIIACLHAILNASESNNSNNDDTIVPDSVLAKFREATRNQTPAERCRELEQNNDFKTVHRSFALQGQSKALTATNQQNQVKHHFVAFVLHNGQLLELDGTRPGPRVVVAEPSNVDVLRGTIAEIQRRLAAGAISEHLSMMTLGNNDSKDAAN